MNKEFEKIRTAYHNAVESGDEKSRNEVIDFHLRAYLQEQHTVISFAIEDAEALLKNNLLAEKISELYKKKDFLDNLVFNDENWNEFSQKIKSGDFYN